MKYSMFALSKTFNECLNCRIYHIYIGHVNACWVTCVLISRNNGAINQRDYMISFLL